MSGHVAGRRRGLALLLGGVALMLFVLSHPFGEVAAAATSPQWVLSHSFHFLGATLVLLGLSAVRVVPFPPLEVMGW